MTKIPETIKKKLVDEKDSFKFTKYEWDMRKINDNIVDKLEGRTPTTEFSFKDDSDTVYYELKILSTDYDGQITNGDSWVARIKQVNFVTTEVMVNPDFDDPEERKLISDALMRGFKPIERVRV